MEEQLLEEWQERLGLQDWVICLRYDCAREDLRSQDAIGETEWVTELKAATIRIVDGKFDRGGILDFDFEKTLVHELLHIKFSMLEISVQNYETALVDLTQHQLIDDMARALIMAKRGQTKRELGKNCMKVKKMTHED